MCHAGFREAYKHWSAASSGQLEEVAIIVIIVVMGGRQQRRLRILCNTISAYLYISIFEIIIIIITIIKHFVYFDCFVVCFYIYEI